MLLGLINQRTVDLVTLHRARGIACNTVSPAEDHITLAKVEEHLRAMPMCVAGVVSHGVQVGATRALAVTQLWSGNAVDLRQADLRFLPRSSVTMIESLVADFGATGDAILATVDMEQILRSALDEE